MMKKRPSSEMGTQTEESSFNVVVVEPRKRGKTAEYLASIIKNQIEVVLETPPGKTSSYRKFIEEVKNYESSDDDETVMPEFSPINKVDFGEISYISDSEETWGEDREDEEDGEIEGEFEEDVGESIEMFKETNFFDPVPDDYLALFEELFPLAEILNKSW